MIPTRNPYPDWQEENFNKFAVRQLGAIKPSFNGHLINIKYELSISMTFDACCADDEGLTLPIKIFQQPERIQAPQQIEVPAGWAPTVCGHGEFVIPPSGETLPPIEP